MNNLEKSWLCYFVTEYRLITQQIEFHKKYLKNLQDEARRMQDEARRIDGELYLLQKEKEKNLKTFGETMLRCATKNGI